MKKLLALVVKLVLWIMFFPIMLAIKLYKSNKISRLIAIIIAVVGMLIWFLISLVMGTPSSTTADTSGPSSKSIATKTEADSAKIKSIKSNVSYTISVKEGSVFSNNNTYFTVSTKSFNTSLSSDDILFVSEDPDIAKIDCEKISGSKVYYMISGVSEGNTSAYVSSIDGSIVSDKIQIQVLKPIEATSITLECEKTVLAIGESIKSEVDIQPSNTDDKSVSWTSSDNEVAFVSANGDIVGKGDGIAIITATTKNGISATINITVDGSKQLMNVRVTHTRDDDNNIGDEWSYDYSINGEYPSSTMAINAGQKLKFWAKFIEDDTKPDVGEASKNYTVKKEDLTSGFTIQMEINVRENAGPNSGKVAHFTVTFTFTPVE